MGILERRLREKERRREDILAVTRSLLLEKGIQDLSLQDVANALEISKATLYLSFQNKDDLLKVILEDASTSFLSFLEERIKGAVTGVDALMDIAQAFFEFYQDQNDAFVLFGLKEYFAPAFPFVRGGALDHCAEQFIGIIRGCMERGLADGTLDPCLSAADLTSSIVFLSTSLVDKVSKIPSELRSGLPIMHHMKNAFALLLRAVAHPSLRREELLRVLDGKVPETHLN